MLYRHRFNLAAVDRHLVADEVAVVGGAHPVGGPFAVAWRNYMKSVFQKGHMYTISCRPSVILYIAENKTLAGKEDRTHEGEALGRKIAMVFFEEADGGLVRRVHRDSGGMQQQLLTLAELLQTLGENVVPHDPDRTAADQELLLEAQYQDLEVMRYTCTVEPAVEEVHMYTLGIGVHAETALSMALTAEHRTKMVLARALQRQSMFAANETLQAAWNLPLATLSARAAALFPAGPLVPAGKGRGGGRAKGRGRGRRG